jgi:hypothetical protein
VSTQLSCDENEIDGSISVGTWAMTSNSLDHTTHLTYDEISAYLDGAMSTDHRRRTEGHLETCDDCRREVIASRDALATAPSVRNPRSLPWKRYAIGAVAGLAVVIGLSIGKRNEAKDTQRDTPAPRREVSIITPADGSIVGNDRRLMWHSIATDATYRVTIGDDQAQPVYSTTAQDTSIVIPSSVAMAHGKKFVWYVDAIRPDGVTATSGVRSFTIE